MSSLTEKDALVTSLQEQLREVREKLTTDAVREPLNMLMAYQGCFAFNHLIDSHLLFLQNIMAQLTVFQTEIKETLQTLFPQIPLELEQVRKGWSC